MIDKIDFVITWVDGNDPVWLEERNHYAVLDNREVDNSSARYRDWDTLRYWFRGVEKFAPWVNNIFFVTCGHLPEWLSVNHPKLKIIKHSDYIPKEYLPTFNSNVIEFYFHRIPELSERFVYFNDDMFLIDTVKPDRFFMKGLPCDMGEVGLKPDTDIFGCSVFLATDLINKHFSPKDVLRKDFTKWCSLEYPMVKSLRNYLLMRKMDLFPRFVDGHLPQAHLKKVFSEVWKYCEKDLVRTSHNKFRSYGDVAFWLIRYWQLSSGNFTPYNIFRDGYPYMIGDKNISVITDCIRKQKIKIICLNDTETISDFDLCKRKIHEAFDEILPEKCSYEC